MIEFKKIYTSNAENLYNLSIHWIIEMLLVLYNAHIILRDQNKFVFYVNNYIDWDQFNQIYDPDQMDKGIKNADPVACKLGPALTKATNYKEKLPAKRGKKRKIQ